MPELPLSESMVDGRPPGQLGKRLVKANYGERAAAAIPGERMMTPELFLRQYGQFNPDAITIQDRRRMRQDFTIKMALWYAKAPLIRAERTINCDDRAIQAGVTELLDNVHQPLYKTALTKFDWGYKGAIKQFRLGRIWATYESPETGKQEPVWNDDDIAPVVLGTPIGLPPEYARVKLDKGHFKGIITPLAILDKRAGNVEDPVPPEWCMWYVNEFEEEDRNYYGRARIDPAYELWYAYWFNFHMRNRNSEADGDPPLQVWYPPGTSPDANGVRKDNREIALDMGRQLRSGATIAWPSDVHIDDQGKMTTQKLWEADFLKGGENLGAFSDLLADLEIGKLRACLVPEQALVEAKRGCLTADTPISMPRDHAKHPAGVPICDVQPGDLVWAFNQVDQLYELRPVKDVWCTQRDALVYRVIMDDGTELKGTADHPVLLRDNTWKQLGSLVPGDRLMPFHERKRATRYYNGNRCRSGDFEVFASLSPDKQDTRAEHRLIAEYLGWVDPDMDVHHINGRHADSRPDNLAYLTKTEHSQLHMADPERRRRALEALLNASEERKALSNPRNWSEEVRAGWIAKHRAAGAQKIADYKERLGEQEYLRLCSERSKAGWNDRTEPILYTLTCQLCDARFESRGNGTKICPDCAEPRRVFGRGSYVFAERSCEQCECPYNPTSPTQRQCAGCRTRKCRECDVEFVPRSNTRARCDDCLAKYPNHFVVRVEECGTADVWDMHIDAPDHIRCFVAAGVVVHNTSSRNASATFVDIFTQSLEQTAKDLDHKHTKYLIRPLVEANWGKDAPKCELVTTGFQEEDLTLATELIKAAFTQDPNALPIDFEELIEKVGLPMYSKAEQQEREDAAVKAQEEAAAQQAEQQAELEAQGQAPQLSPGSTQPAQLAASQDYKRTRPRKYEFEHIQLSTVPDWAREEQRRRQRNINTLAGQLHEVIVARYEDAFEAAAEALSGMDGIQLAGIQLSIPDVVGQIVSRIRNWIDRKLAGYRTILEGELGAVYHAGGAVELSRLGLSGESWDVGRQEVQEWAQRRAGELITTIDKTVVDQHIRPWLTTRLSQSGYGDAPQGVPVDTVKLAMELTEKYRDYPHWMAERVARSEARMGYNQSAADMWERVGIEEVDLFDGLGGRTGETDPDCLARNGQRASLLEFRRLDREEHPNGTLGAVPVTDNVDLRELEPGVIAELVTDQAAYEVDSGLVLAAPVGLVRKLLRRFVST